MTQSIRPLLKSSAGETVVTDFGAVGDGITLNTRAIQASINAAASSGGSVRVPAGVFRTGTLHLRSGTTLVMDLNAVIQGSDSLEDYPETSAPFIDAVGEPRGRCLILAHRAADVSIIGHGSIDGGGAEFTGPHRYSGRPMLLRFVQCTRVVVNDVHLKNSAAWVSHYQQCDQVRVERVTIQSWANHNNDGIDIDSCRHVLVSDCDIDTGDDAICLKATSDRSCEEITVRNCRLRSGCGAIKIGTESYGDFRRIRIVDCSVRDTGLCAIKVISMDGAVIDDVQIDRIQVQDSTGPLFVRLGDRQRTYGHAHQRPKPPGLIRNLCISNITATVRLPDGPIANPYTKVLEPPKAFSGITVTGVPGHRGIQGLSFHDIDITFAGGGEASDAAMQPAEQMGDYPEHYYFGTLPAWAFFIRHVQSVSMRDIHIRVRSADARPAIVLDDVEDFFANQLVADGAIDSASSMVACRNSASASINGYSFKSIE